jgi:D-amino-acid dehydrogenase
VTVLERAPAQRDGCSFGNTGMVVPSHFVPLAAPGMVALGLKWMWQPAAPFYVRPRASWSLVDWALKFWRAANAAHVARTAPLLLELLRASQENYDELAGAERDFGLEKRGLLLLCKSAHALEEEAEVAALARSLGLAAEVVDAKRAAELEPGIRMEVAGAVHYPGDGNLAPERLVASLERRLVAAGGRLEFDKEISGWRVERRAIRTARLADGEEIEADEFVLAAGAWSPGLVRELGLRLPMQPGKGYSLTLREPRRAPRLCALLAEARIAVSPIADGGLRFGGTMELSGLNGDILPERVRSIVEAVPRYYPELGPRDFEGVQPWRGLRPCSPDGLPYLGRSARLANLVVATGHAMLGISLAPVTGRIVAQIVSGEESRFDLGPLSPDRYH